MVIVNADALIEAPKIVMMTAEEVVVLQDTLNPAMLLEPTEAVGVTDNAKKL